MKKKIIIHLVFNDIFIYCVELACPSAVGVEISAEGSSQFYPVGAVLSATGLTTINFSVEVPQVAALVLLRLYKPRDSSNIGLAQIRLLGSLALPTSSGASSTPSSTGDAQVMS